ncbi:MAG: ImmA/IrrE family metallo-endopeptidase, partial [Chloroflexota bacterium]
DLIHISHNIKQDLLNVFDWLDERGDLTIKIDYKARQITGSMPNTESKNHKDLESDINKFLDALAYDFEQFEITDFATNVAKHIQFNIELLPFDFTKATSGLCVKINDKYLIFFNCNRTKVLQDHIIVHELGHIVLQHKLIPMIALNSLIEIRLRSYTDTKTYSGKEEKEAEKFSQHVLMRVMSSRRHIILNANTTIVPLFTE